MKNIILLSLIIIACFVAIGNVAAANTIYHLSDFQKDFSLEYTYEYNGLFYSKPVTKTVYDTKLISKTPKLIKKNNIYYIRYTKTYNHTVSDYQWMKARDHHNSWWTGWGELSVDSTTSKKIQDVKVKKGDIVKKTPHKLVMTVEANGKVYEHYTHEQTVALNSKKLNTTTISSKKLSAYYRVFEMPKIKVGTNKKAIFKGNQFTYGNSHKGYYVNNIKNKKDISNTGIYKVKPNYFTYRNAFIFKKKPSTFKIYIKA